MEGVLIVAGAYTNQLITSSVKLHILIASLLVLNFVGIAWVFYVECLVFVCITNQVVSFICLG